MSDHAGGSASPLLIELGGEIDLRNADVVDEALCAAIDRMRRELSFIDSSGMGMMIRVHEHTTMHNSGVGWRGSRSAPARAVAAMGLDDVLHFDT